MRRTSVLQRDVVAIERRSSVGYLHAVIAAQAERRITVSIEPGSDPGALPVEIAGRLACALGGGWFTERFAPANDPAPAQISLTSGTTGAAKAIVLSHRALGDVTGRLVDVMSLDDSVREYVGVPVTYSFGFARVRAVAAAGGRSFLPEHGFRVDELTGMLGRGEVNALSAVPTLLRIVIDQADRFAEVGPALRWLEIGSQAMSAAEKAQVRAIFPNARIIQHYGLTEASRSTFLDISSADDAALESVGRPTGAAEIRITDDGRIAIRGPHVADGVLTEAGLEPLTDAEGWLITADLGSQHDGLLRFGGRADDLINIGGVKVPAEAFEAQLLARLGAGFPLAVAAGADPLRGQLVVVAHEPLATEADADALARAIDETAAEMNIGDGHARWPLDRIPRTDTNKILRRQISADFDQARAARPAPALAPAAGAGQGVVEAFVSVFGERGRDEAASFESLGGDSLNFVMMLTALEPHLRALPDDWYRLTVGDLAALAEGGDGAGQGVVAAFVSVFGQRGRNEAASFESLGGDSLNFVMMLTALEPHLRPVPDDWYKLSVGALAALAESGSAAGPAGEARRYIPTNLDTVRTLACTLVVALHVVGTGRADGLRLPPGSAWHQVMDALDLIRIPLFTALAGFLYGAMPATNEGLGRFMRRKTDQLLLPLLFATLVFWGLRRLTYGLNESLFWAYVDGYQHLWYLDALLLIFAFVGFVDTRFNPTTRTWLGLLAVIAASYWAIPDVPVLHLRDTISVLPYFVFGVLLYRVPALLQSRALFWASAACVASVVVIEQLAPRGLDALDPSGILRWLCGAGSVVVLLKAFPKLGAVERIAAYTFTIYLWHPAANAAVRNALQAAGLTSIPALFAIGLVAGLAIPVLIHMAMSRLPAIVRAPIIGK